MAAYPRKSGLEILRDKLKRLKKVMAKCGDSFHTQLVRNAVSGSEEELSEFLISNTLWGGAGSIADRFGFSSSVDAREQFNSAMVELGEAQIEADLISVRTESWLDFSRSLQKSERSAHRLKTPRRSHY